MLLDNILIGLYLMTGETHKRQQFANKLYRMMNKELIYSVSGKKGLYTTIKPQQIPSTDDNKQADNSDQDDELL